MICGICGLEYCREALAHFEDVGLASTTDEDLYNLLAYRLCGHLDSVFLQGIPVIVDCLLHEYYTFLSVIIMFGCIIAFVGFSL